MANGYTRASSSPAIDDSTTGYFTAAADRFRLVFHDGGGDDSAYDLTVERMEVGHFDLAVLG